MSVICPCIITRKRPKQVYNNNVLLDFWLTSLEKESLSKPNFRQPINL